MQFEKLMRVAGSQSGAISYQQALEVMTRRQFERLIAQGVVHRVLPSIYTVCGLPETWRQAAFAATLWIPGSALSHHSAARIWGMSFAAGERIHVSVTKERAFDMHGPEVHRVGELARFTCRQDGLPVTSVERTILDMSAHMTEGQLGAILDQAFHKKLTDLAAVGECLDVSSTQGRSGVGNLRKVLSARGQLDASLESFFERKVLRLITGAGLPQPKAQHKISLQGSRYRLDFAYVAAKVAVECDGPHHQQHAVITADRRRDSDLRLGGWIVIRHAMGDDEASFLRRLRQILVNRDVQPTE